MRKIFMILLLAAMALTVGGYGNVFADDEVVITADKVTGDISFDPNHRMWAAAKPYNVPLICQTITNPKNIHCATSKILVSVVTNGKQIGIKMDWVDVSKDELNIQHEQFRDAAAVMFPVKAGDEPSFTMGNAGNMVNIWHWKSEWQKDHTGSTAATERMDMEDVYPYMSADWYVDEEPDGKVSYHDRQGKHLGSFDPAASSGNIFSKIDKRRSAVEDLNAEGFGTLTTQETQNVDGHGAWNQDGWRVVFVRDLADSDKNDVQLTGDSTPIAFAVWDGSNSERNGLKSISRWNVLKLK